MTPQPQVSLTLEDQRTGYVAAIAGGRGDKTASRTLNRATQTLRQPGSTFKVVSTYAPALDAAGKTLATTYVDEPYTYSDGTPVRNWYGEAYRGTTTIRTAIRDSMNIIAVKCLTDITPELGYAYLLNFGFTTLVDNEEINGSIYSDVRQTLALGGVTNGVKNIELNAAYATIANGGVYMEPKFYTKITDHDGNVILDNTNQKTRTVLKDSTAYLLTSAMEDVVTSGTGTMCQITETPVAGKTGTTSDENDVWFAGFSNYYTCTTWAGYDENTNLSGSEAGDGAGAREPLVLRFHAALRCGAGDDLHSLREACSQRPVRCHLHHGVLCKGHHPHRVLQRILPSEHGKGGCTGGDDTDNKHRFCRAAGPGCGQPE